MNHPLKLLLHVPAGSWWLQPVALGCSGFAGSWRVVTLGLLEVQANLKWRLNFTEEC